MTVDTLHAILPWTLPILLGAIIGYLTNNIAIRMLFRPIHPIRFFGIRLPFTPGVIPRQRKELAESIGRMVSRDLLTDDVFYRRFSDAGFRIGLQRGVSRGLARLESMPLGVAMQLVGAEQAIKYASRWLVQALTGSSGERIRRQISGWAAQGMSAHARELAAMILDLVESSRPLSPVAAEDVSSVIDENWTIIVDQIETILARRDVQDELHHRVQRIVTYSLDQLTSMQRLLVTAAQYDRQIEARIPTIVDRIVSEVISAVQSRDNRTRILTMVEEWLEQHRHRTIGSFLTRETTNQMRDSLERYLRNETRVQEDLERQIDQLIRGLHRGESRDQVAHLLTFWIREHSQDRLGELLPIIRRRRSVLSRFASVHVQRILSGLTRMFLEQLDVYSVVVDRINSLDVERVEGLLMGIIHKHLRWINVFGAVLGSLIGAVQVVLRLLGVV